MSGAGGRRLGRGLLLLVLVVSSGLAEEAPRPDARLGNVMWRSPDPAVWTTTLDDGWVVFRAMVPDGQSVVLRVAPGFESAGEFRGQFDRWVERDLKGTVVTARLEPVAQTSQSGYPMLRQSVTGLGPGGATFRWYLGLNPGDRFEMVACAASSDALFQGWAPRVVELINTIRFVNLAGELVPAGTEPTATAQPAAPPPAPAAAPPTAPAPAGPPPKAPGPRALPAGHKGLDGLFFWLETWMFGGNLSISHQHLVLRPNGQAFRGCPPGGLENFDFDRLAQLEPKRTGYYSLVGDKLHFEPLQGKPEVLEFAREEAPNLQLNGFFAKKVGKFPASYRFEGWYEAARSAGGGGAYVAQVRTFRFHLDGTFSSGALGAVSTAEVGGASEDRNRGSYELSGNTITLRYADGRVEVLCAFPYPEKDELPPHHLNIDGAMFKRVE